MRRLEILDSLAMLLKDRDQLETRPELSNLLEGVDRNEDAALINLTEAAPLLDEWLASEHYPVSRPLSLPWPVTIWGYRCDRIMDLDHLGAYRFFRIGGTSSTPHEFGAVLTQGEAGGDIRGVLHVDLLERPGEIAEISPAMIVTGAGDARPAQGVPSCICDDFGVVVIDFFQPIVEALRMLSAGAARLEEENCRARIGAPALRLRRS
jgi:hypothetical protein